jgi:hypothetical protein
MSSDGSRIATAGDDRTAKVWDARPTRGGPLDQPRRFEWRDTEDVAERLFRTRSRVDLNLAAYRAARKDGDEFAARFHLDRLCALSGTERPRWLSERAAFQPDPCLVARTGFHTPALAGSSYDPQLIRLLAAGGDRTALRVVAQLLMRNGHAAKAIPLLHSCLMCRPAASPPVEELLIASALLHLGRPDDARRYYRAAAEWLDRPTGPIRAVNIVAHSMNPWNGIAESFKPIADPRHNLFDWESWHECDVFRAEFERAAAVPSR